MITPGGAMEQLNRRFGERHRYAFFGAILLGLLIHLPVMLSDIPNHDGLASMYFDQNMITSGRWFLTVACGFSSYFTVPWIIGLIGLFFLGLTSAALTELLELKNKAVILLCSGLLVAFPSLASTFAYVFTLDGYMLALLLSVLAVLLTKKLPKWGFPAGALCLAFSMGIYQAYLPFAILLCIYQVLLLFAEADLKKDGKRVLRQTGAYLLMGLLGMVLYYVILKILLLIQGKELASYQGISSASDGVQGGIAETLIEIYRDFLAFTVKGNVLTQNLFSGMALVVLTVLTCMILLLLATKRKWWKQPGFYGIMLLLAAVLPVCTSCIRLVSKELNYHLLMRYQWVLFLICMAAFCERYADEVFDREKASNALAGWILILSGTVLVFCYGLGDNIAYTNLEKRYEKTYAYCVRLLDRIEQTEGYYQGIPVAIMGVVGEDSYPPTDLTGKVTGGMIGLSGDMLLYTGENYESFIRNYLGASLNIVDVDTMGEIYYTQTYVEMDSFPGPDSTKVVDGILYVKTENSRR